jgi:preprotein translocase subunit SecG
MPILLAWVGGLIGFLVVRDSDKGKANGLLILGIIMTVFWIVLSIGLSALSFFAWY